MRVKGDILDVQSNLDFYLKITSTGNLKTVDDLRSHFFNIFLKEEREQSHTLLEEKTKLENRKKAQALEEVSLETGNKELEIGNMDIVEQVDEEPVEEVISNTTSNASAFLNDVSQLGIQEEEVDDEEYCEHGIYIDELEIEPEEVVNEEPTEVEEEEYCEHGVYLDELPDEVLEIEDNYGNEESDFTEEGTWEDLMSELGEEPIEEVPEEVDTKPQGTWEDLMSELGEESVKEVIEEVPEEGINIISTESDLDLEVAKEEDPVNIPSDLREFLRQHPNSSVSYVMKYYTKKEIDKQIKMGRVYKKKGKLFI